MLLLFFQFVVPRFFFLVLYAVNERANKNKRTKKNLFALEFLHFFSQIRTKTEFINYKVFLEIRLLSSSENKINKMWDDHHLGTENNYKGVIR